MPPGIPSPLGEGGQAPDKGAHTLHTEAQLYSKQKGQEHLEQKYRSVTLGTVGPFGGA